MTSASQAISALGTLEVRHEHGHDEPGRDFAYGDPSASVSASCGSSRAGTNDPTSISRCPASYAAPNPFELLRGRQGAREALQPVTQADFAHDDARRGQRHGLSRSARYAGSVRNSAKVSSLTSAGEDARRFVVAAVAEAVTEIRADLRPSPRESASRRAPGDLASVVEHAVRRAHPLPDLRARDLGGGGVLHQVEDRHGALAREPGADVLDRHVDVEPQPASR